MSAPHTATITITRAADGHLEARHRNGGQDVLLAVAYPPALELAEPRVLFRGGAALREALPGVDGRELLDLLERAELGDHEVEDRRPIAFPSRRDVDFGEAA